MRVMGLDIGEKRIGIAISDPLCYTAQGKTVMERRGVGNDIQTIKDLVSAEEVTALVVGLPKNMDGTLGEGAERVLTFVRMLEGALSMAIILWDERWTTVEATRVLLEADMTRQKRRKVVDKVAAVLILQGYLDSLDHHVEKGAQP
jgi:putative Holliday junction resolvase